MIRILCVGKLKEKYWQDATIEYLKRLKKYTNIELVEIPDCSIDEKGISLEREMELIKKNIKPKDYIITLEIEGRELSSVEFSKKIEATLVQNSNISFIIGGSHGIHDEIKSIANYRLSFSKMTFPHQLFRVILLEQIYRAYKIIHNEKYHK